MPQPSPPVYPLPLHPSQCNALITSHCIVFARAKNPNVSPFDRTPDTEIKFHRRVLLFMTKAFASVDYDHCFGTGFDQPFADWMRIQKGFS